MEKVKIKCTLTSLLLIIIYCETITAEIIDFLPQHSGAEEDCTTYITEVHSADDISCSFENSLCCWYSKGGNSEKFKWTLSNSQQNRQVPLPDDGDGFLILRSNETETMDQLFSPKFTVASPDVVFSISFFRTNNSKLSFFLMEYENDESNSNPLDVETSLHSTWQTVNISLEDDLDNFKNTFEIFIQGEVGLNVDEFVAIKNLVLKDKALTTTEESLSTNLTTVITIDVNTTTEPENNSTTKMTDSGTEDTTNSTEISITDSETKNATNSTTELLITEQVTNDTTDSATKQPTTEPTDEECNKTSKIRNLEDISCAFHNSTCCWTSDRKSPNSKWKLSYNSLETDIHVPKDGKGFLMLHSNIENEEEDTMLSPLFSVYSSSVNLSISVYCSEGAELNIVLFRYGMPSQINLLINLNKIIERNKWSTIDNIDVSVYFKNSYGNFYQIFLLGKVKSKEVIAVKDFELKGSYKTTTIYIQSSTTDTPESNGTTSDQNFNFTSSKTTETDVGDANETTTITTIKTVTEGKNISDVTEYQTTSNTTTNSSNTEFNITIDYNSSDLSTIVDSTTAESVITPFFKKGSLYPQLSDMWKILLLSSACVFIGCFVFLLFFKWSVKAYRNRKSKSQWVVRRNTMTNPIYLDPAYHLIELKELSIKR